MDQEREITVNNGDILHSTPEFMEWIRSQNLPPIVFNRTYVVWRVGQPNLVGIAVYRELTSETREIELFPLDIPVSVASGMKVAWQAVKQPSLDEMLEIVARHGEFLTKHPVDRHKLRNGYGADFEFFLIFQDWLDAYNDEAFMATQEIKS